MTNDTGLAERLRALCNYDVGERPWIATELADQAASRIEALEAEVERLRAELADRPTNDAVERAQANEQIWFEMWQEAETRATRSQPTITGADRMTPLQAFNELIAGRFERYCEPGRFRVYWEGGKAKVELWSGQLATPTTTATDSDGTVHHVSFESVDADN